MADSTSLATDVTLAPLSGPAWSVADGLVVGALAYGLSIVLYITCAQQLGATRSQLVFSAAPIWGTLLAVLLLGDAFTLQHALTAVVLAASTALLLHKQRGHPQTHGAQLHGHRHAYDDSHHIHLHENPFARA